MKYSFLTLLFLMSILSYLPLNSRAQNTGVGIVTPQTRFHVSGTSWFQGDNTPLPPAAGNGVAIGYGAGLTGGYVFAFNYGTFTPRNLWLNSTGGSVLVNSTTSAPAGRLEVAGAGLRAISASTTGGEGVYAYSSGGHGLFARSGSHLGLYALSDAPSNAGTLSEGNYIGVQGSAKGADGNRQGVRGEVGGTGGYAGLFSGGTTWVVGTLTKNAGAFLIDHPLTPDTKFLYHSFVESPDMKNIYDGIITTDADGIAVVTMPDWFDALNIEFRYQLTSIGQFSQAIVLDEIHDNQFTIKTDKPNVKVSWQLTGIRNDPYARDKRIPTEKLKLPSEVGKYIYPEGYGKTQEDLLDILKPTRFADSSRMKW